MMMLRLTLFPCLFYIRHVGANVTSSANQHSFTAAPSNASIPSFSNTSSSNSANFSYIIPYGQHEECNIYGPVCQTGSITVGVNLTTKTTNTVLPCSSYLTAQSNYLLWEASGDPDGALNPEMVDGMPNDWLVSFGHSPECRSYAQEYKSGRYTISGCGNQNTLISLPVPVMEGAFGDAYPTQIPPAVVRYIDPVNVDLCCGNCSASISQVRLYYFPDIITPDCPNNQTSNSSSILSGENLEKRVHSLISNGSIAVLSGHTFTSPSVYLQILGTAAVGDECTTLGPILTDPIMSFPPGVLSTWKPPPASDLPYEDMSFSVGDVWEDPDYALDERSGYSPLTIKDLACPTWGLGRSTSADGSVITTIGAPWLPLIAPPIELFSLDPTWASLCTGFIYDQLDGGSILLFDPPVALTRASVLVPVVASTPVPAPNNAQPTTVPDRQAAPSTAAAKPAKSPTDPANPPARTADPGRDSPSPSLAIASADPAGPGSPPGDPVATPTNKNDPPGNPKVPQPVNPAGSTIPEDPTVPPSKAGDPASPVNEGDPPTAPADPKAPDQPAPQQADGSQPPTQGLGAIIYNAFGKSGPEVGGNANEVNTISVPIAGVQQVSIGGGHVLSIDPSGVTFQGKTYSIGGPAMTISNSVYTLVAQHGSANSAVDADQNLADSLPAAPDTLTIAGQTVVPNPTGMVVAGSRVLPGGSAVTVSNTPISLAPSGILVVGSSSFSLPPQSVFTVGSQSFVANPTGFILDGATISPGGAAQTIDGTIISLGQSGALALGSTTISLSTPTPYLNSSALTVAGQTFTPNPKAFSIAGTTISAGGPAVTLAGTVISLGQSGALAIGSAIISLPTPSFPSPAISTLTIDGQTFTPNPTAFSIAGTTISAGGPAVTVAGTIISLEPSGTLIVGSSTIPLLTPQTPLPSLVNIDGLSVEAGSSFAIVDDVTIKPGASGVTIDGSVVSLEAGGATLDVGTGRFAMPTGVGNGSSGLVPFEGGQNKGIDVSFLLLLSGIGWTLIILGG